MAKLPKRPLDFTRAIKSKGTKKELKKAFLSRLGKVLKWNYVASAKSPQKNR